MAKLFPYILLINLFISLFIFSACSDKDKEVNENDVVVTVNGEEITRSQLNKNITQFLRKYGLNLQDNNMDQLKRIVESNVISFMVEQTLVLQEAKKHHIQVTEEEIEVELENIKSHIPKEMTFEELLELQNYTEEDLREEIKNTLLYNKVMSLKHLDEEIEVTTDEIVHHYEKLLIQNNERLESFDMVKENIKHAIQQEKYLNKLRNDADIKVFNK